MRITSLTLCGLLACSALALGQDAGPRRYFPLNTPLPPPGRAGQWASRLGKATPIKFQQVQIQLPGDGQVIWFEGLPDRGIVMPAPAMAGLLVGPVYRVKLTKMPDFPGVELYPSIEMVDRLHPPAGRETQFPVIIPFTVEELQAAIEGRLVTKVIYLEQPNRAALVTAERGKAIPAIRVNPAENALEVADVHGRPLAIVRLGGRVPDINRPEPGFFGTGAPVQVVNVAQAPADDSIVVPTPRSGRKPTAVAPPIVTPEAETPDTPDAPRPKVPQPEVPQPDTPESETPDSKASKSEEPEPEANKTPEPDAGNTPEPAAESTDEPALESTPEPEPAVKAADFE